MTCSLSTRCLLATVGLALTLLGSGCDNTIEPFSERTPFSIHGYLSLSEARQFIRVKALDDPLVADSTRTLDATVTLENPSTGTSTLLQDSIVVFDDIATHNFWADVALQPEMSYRVTVTGSNGQTTEATTTTPAATPAERTPASGTCLTPFTLTLPGLSDSRRLRVAIGFRYDGRMRWVDQDAGLHGNAATATFTPEPVLAEVIPSVDDPRTALRLEPRCWELDTDRLYIAYTHFGPDWTRDLQPGDIDFDPTESRFVENGLGFFGALRRDTLSVTVDTSDVIPLR